LEGVQVRVFHIPIQGSSHLLKKRFRQVEEARSLLAAGSSTAVAAPDQIAKMGSVSMKEVQAESSIQIKVDPVVAELRSEQERGNTVLVENVVDHYNKPRFQCKVSEVNDLYAIFLIEKDGQETSGSVKRTSVSYEPMMKMKLFTIALIT
jgi:hypothetical protein